MSELPPLPKGFVLDDASPSAFPPLPSGFSLDARPSFGQQMKSAVTDIPSEIGGAAASNLSAINDAFNPYSPRQKAIQDQSKSASWYDLSPEWERIKAAGSGLAAIPGLLASPVTGASRSLIGHGMSAVTPGMTYEEGKDAADTAMMGLRPQGKFTTVKSPSGPPTTLTQPNGETINITPPSQTSVQYSPPTRPADLPTPGKIKEAARAAYQSPEVTGLDISPQSVGNFSQKVENDLLKQGYRQKTADGVFEEIQSLVPGQGVQSVKVADLDAARRALRKYAEEVNSVGKPTTRAAAAETAIRHIDDYMANIGPGDVIAGDAAKAQALLKEARANWAAGSRAQEVDFRLSQAERQAAKSGSGSNIENARRQKIDKVPEYGLTSEEKLARDRIVLGSKPRNALRKAGKLGVDGGLSLMLHSAAAVGSGGTTLPITAAGTIARKIGEALTAREIKQLQEMIRARSPLAQSMPPRQIQPPGLFPLPVFANGLAQRLPLFPGAIPAGADQDEKVRRRP